MKAAEIRGMQDDEILFELEKLQEELFQMKFRSLTEGNPDPAKIRRTRRDIARLKTILEERRRAARSEAAQEA